MIQSHDERRYNAGRPYFKPVNQHQVSAKSDHLYSIVLSTVVGAMLGATLALMWVGV